MKIKLVVADGNNQARVLCRKDFIERCKYNNVIFTNDDDVDAILIHNVLLDDKILNNSKIPLIILEKFDSVTIANRMALKNKNVIGIIKNTTLRDPALNNSYTKKTMFPTKLPYDYTSESEITLNDDDLSKLYLGYTYAMYDIMEPIINNFKLEKDIRKIDCNFYGTVNYKNPNISLHRQTCLDQLNRLSTKYNILGGSGRPLKTLQYHKILEISSSGVSPWGWGEACFRDFEIILSGSILIKPDTSFVVGAQDIYQNNIHYIPCKMDFSDLDEKIDYIKSNWNKLYDMRYQSLNYLLSWWKKNVFADYFSQLLKDIVDKRKI